MFSGLKKAFSGFSNSVNKLSITTISEEDLDDAFEELNLQLLQNNVAFDVAELILDRLKEQLVGLGVEKKRIEDLIRDSFREVLLEILKKSEFDLQDFKSRITSNKPFLMLFVGANGAGKTTTIAKVANYFRDLKIVMAAGDTFRDASIEQLAYHAEVLGIRLIKHQYGADSAAVIFDAEKFAQNKHFDLVLGDTAGRSHSNVNLMDELHKIGRVNSPDFTVLVIDSLVGNDIVHQLEIYDKLGFDAVILTKLDADDKGGAILNAAALSEKPIMFLGVGQGYSNLEVFEAEKIVQDFLNKN